jgi:hypothetical protein
LRGSAKTSGTWTGNSLMFCIPVSSGSTRLYFEREGRCSSNLAGTLSPCGGSLVPSVKTRYRATVTILVQSPTPTPPAMPTVYADIKVTWPAEADPTTTTPSGSVEMLAALDRN